MNIPLKSLTQPLSQSLSRRHFIRAMTATGVSVALAQTLAGRAHAQAEGITDLDILQLALTAEYLAVDAYTFATNLTRFPGEIQPYFEAALAQEEEHVAALQDTIRAFGSTPVTRPSFTYPLEFTADSQLPVLRLMNALEDAFVGAYLGALPLIENKDVLAAAGAILGNECVHRALVRDARLELGDTELVGPPLPNDRAFEVAITPAEAQAAVESFIG